MGHLIPAGTGLNKFKNIDVLTPHEDEVEEPVTDEVEDNYQTAVG
jgi:hypothetical protein